MLSLIIVKLLTIFVGTCHLKNLFQLYGAAITNKNE